MKEKRFLCLFLMLSLSLSAQLKGVVVDEQNNPIPFVNIWVEGENIGSSTEENGTFILHTNNENSRLLFNALGYEKKTILAKDCKKVVLKESLIELNEVIISKRLETKRNEIGKNDNQIFEAFPNGPKVDCKFFPFLPEYKKTPYIKQVTIQTDSKIEDASIKLYFYSVGADGLPDENLLKKENIVYLKKGVYKHKFDVSDYHLVMPKNGIFVVFEKLMIEKNKLEKTVVDRNSNLEKTERLYFPFVLYDYVARKEKYVFYGGKWNMETHQDKIKLYEPAINLVLTN
ncbi:carboxypeptidase-like regulatory domain-containing protein [Flavobacterium sp.]